MNHMGVSVDPAWDLDTRPEGLPLPPIRYGTNLIFNGDAEYNSGTNDYKPDRGIAWWWDYSGTTLGVYGSNTNFPVLDSSGPTNRGRNFFLGGTNANTFISQTIKLDEIASDIDDPGVDYRLSGWLGGAGASSNQSLSIRFLSVSNAVLGTNVIGPVTALERVVSLR